MKGVVSNLLPGLSHPLLFKAIGCVTYVVVLGFYIPPTVKVIRRRDLGLKSHP